MNRIFFTSNNQQYFPLEKAFLYERGKTAALRMSLTPFDFLSGKMQVSPPAVKLQYTLKESPEHPWLGSM